MIDFEGSQMVTTSVKVRGCGNEIEYCMWLLWLLMSMYFVQEVVFVCLQTSNGEKQTLHTPPFITGSWIKKSIGEPIEVTIKYKVL